MCTTHIFLFIRIISRELILHMAISVLQTDSFKQHKTWSATLDLCLRFDSQCIYSSPPKQNIHGTDNSPMSCNYKTTFLARSWTYLILRKAEKKQKKKHLLPTTAFYRIWVVSLWRTQNASFSLKYLPTLQNHFTHSSSTGSYQW